MPCSVEKQHEKKHVILHEHCRALVVRLEPNNVCRDAREKLKLFPHHAADGLKSVASKRPLTFPYGFTVFGVFFPIGREQQPISVPFLVHFRSQLSNYLHEKNNKYLFPFSCIFAANYPTICTRKTTNICSLSRSNHPKEHDALFGSSRTARKTTDICQQFQ